MPQKNLTYLSPAKLKPYDKNPRQNEKAVEAVKRSLVEFGFQNPIIADKNLNVIAGHTRLKAAQALGLKEVPVLIADGLTPAQIKAYRIADNQTGNIAEWDMELLPLEIAELEADGFDVTLLGFPDDELGRITQKETEGLTDPDEIPEAPEAITKPGDLWLLGEHRLLCGDSTRAEDVARVMAGTKADLWLTDPPYGVSYVGKTKKALEIENENLSDGQFREFLGKSFLLGFEHLKSGGVYYIWHGHAKCFEVLNTLFLCKQVVRQFLIWKKQSFVMSRQDYHWQHESCVYGWKDGAAHGWFADRKQSTILEFDRPKSSEEHPTMKPVGMMTYLINNSTAGRGAVVLDTFLGSGTTLIAAEQLNRKCYGLEISPQYCDVIVKRWENFTGKKAELEKKAKAA